MDICNTFKMTCPVNIGLNEYQYIDEFNEIIILSYNNSQSLNLRWFYLIWDDVLSLKYVKMSQHELFQSVKSA